MKCRMIPLICLLSAVPPGARAAAPELPPLETRLLGQSQWMAGAPASLRLITTDHRTGKPVRADVVITLAGGPAPSRDTRVFSGQTDSLGTLQARFATPAGMPGAYRLEVAVKSAVGDDKIVRNVRLTSASQILLTADKPVYQPGQIIHMRALALDAGTRQAVAGKAAVFEVEDGRGNKVFKQAGTLSRFGVAAADLQLADEVNMGTYTLRVILPDGQADKKVRVDRYVLPKYKVTLTAGKPFYLPGEKATGTVKAAYFFGKPVAGGDVTVEVNTVDIGVTKLTELHGKTDSEGNFKFEYSLPDSFVGQPFEQGKAVVEFHAAVKDTADHRQEAYVSTPVVKEPVQIAVVPESRALVPKVKNRVYIAAGMPDGAALKQATVQVVAVPAKSGEPEAQATEIKTDDMGIAVYEFTPTGKNVTLKITARTAAGQTATVVRGLEVAPTDGLLLRVDRPLARVGDTLNLSTLASVKGGTVYVDIIRNRQTILTRAENASGGQAQLAVAVTPDMVGTVEIRAYKILPTEEIIRDSRVVVVSPADDLLVTATADRPEYRPGGDAVLRFAVTDAHKQPVAAALGLAMVDESVFALAEMQPGLERVYFALEKELMEPKFEIHGLRPSSLIKPNTPEVIPIRDRERQRAASMLFSAGADRREFDLAVNTYQERYLPVRQAIVTDMQALARRIGSIVSSHADLVKGAQEKKEELGAAIVREELLKSEDLRDGWGHPYRIALVNPSEPAAGCMLSSAGPDGRWDTWDDLSQVGPWGEAGGWQRGVRFRNGAFGGGVRRGLGAMNGGRFMVMEAVGGMDKDAVVDELAMRAPLGATADLSAAKSSGAAEAEPARVRSYFPETMLWSPLLVTDDAGRAEMRVPMADSITTWRLSMMANSASGQLGSATVPIKVFQEFFVDIDLPVALTQNDQVDIPVAVYNYRTEAQDVQLDLEPQAWFNLRGPARQTVHVDAGQVKVVYYPITATSIGRFALTVQAHGRQAADAIRRSVDVRPDGKEFVATINDRLERSATCTVKVPEEALKGATSVWLKLYPGAFAQVVEGLDGILRMPNGCFEQTSSSTYPNVLVLDYLKTTKKANPELQMKAEGYINVGYQRLVTFEVPGGGFSWFGSAPAHQILTAYGLLEFADMSRVSDVDPAVISRTQQWLAGRQKEDGSWEEKEQGIAEGIINRQTGALRSTAYVAWALAETGYDGPQLAKGIAYVKAHAGEAGDAYTLALIVNLLAKVDRDGADTATQAERLIAMATVTDNAAYWKSDTKTMTGAVADGADLETSGLAAFGLAKWGRNTAFLNKALTYLVQSKDSFGTWSSTQGTVWSMKALLFASHNGTGGKGGTITVSANGSEVQKIKITPENNDVMQQLNLLEHIHEGDNNVTLKLEGDTSMLYQLVERHYLPWSRVERPAVAKAPVSIDVAYDKTTLAQNDTAGVTVTIRNNTGETAEMPLIDLGVPPGFDVVPDQLDAAVTQQTISKYTVAARQVIVYLERLSPGQELKLQYQVKARFPIKARTPLSKAYPYYNPERVAVSQPQDITVTK